jgi:hypothetical protein
MIVQLEFGKEKEALVVSYNYKITKEKEAEV